MKTWQEIKTYMETPEFKEKYHKHVSSMKARKRRARIRSDAKWYKDPVLRCLRCGAERKPDTYPVVYNLCPYRNCVVILCYNCKTYIECSFGPVGCPCDRKQGSHNTYDEMPKPSGKRKYRALRRAGGPNLSYKQV